MPSLEGGLRVTWETSSGQLSMPLAAVEREVFSIFQNDAKVKQAQAMPTVLADIARLGAGWMRPMSVWG